jgi:serine/alanine adding enzyme
MLAEHLLTVDDPLWPRLLPARASVFGSVEYARLYQAHRGYAARLFAVTADGGTIALPFFSRPVAALPFGANLGRGWVDIVSPEYTGPVVLTGDVALMKEYRHRFDRVCREEGVIAEFAHLHPWNWRAECCHAEDVAVDREIVYVDLTLPEDRLWSESLTYACRKNLNRARRENIRVFGAATRDHICEFHRIYIHTMERNSALTRYYFPLDYFMAFFEEMRDHAEFVMAEYRDRIVASTLYLHDDVDVYSYLGGADAEFQQIRPTNAVVYHTINWARRLGRRRLVLGGGYRPDDGIFRFKASFSPARAQFRVYRHVHLPAEYGGVCRAWSSHYGAAGPEAGYFPAYRSVPACEAGS